jgi:predicted  nucleic acid-binding Zn-ribbon protein
MPPSPPCAALQVAASERARLEDTVESLRTDVEQLSGECERLRSQLAATNAQLKADAEAAQVRPLTHWVCVRV